MRQSAYAKFNLEEANSVTTPADANQVINNFGDSKTSVFPFRGRGQFVVPGSDISYAVGVVSRYMENPTESHVAAVKRIFKYIKGTIDYGINYSSDVELELAADYAGDRETRRSTSGSVFVLGSGAIAWSSQRHKCVALSTTESEFIAASEAVKELVWVQRLLKEICLEGEPGRCTLFMDNQSAIRLVKNPEFHKRTKHIDVRYHFIREKFEDGLFELNYVATDEQLADIFTKALTKDRFGKLRGMLNVVPA